MSASTREYPLPGTPGYGLRERIARAWCRLVHRAAMLPIHGQYRCRRCFRSYPVTWDGAAKTKAPKEFDRH